MGLEIVGPMPPSALDAIGPLQGPTLSATPPCKPFCAPSRALGTYDSYGALLHPMRGRYLDDLRRGGS